MNTLNDISCLLCGEPAELYHKEYPGYQEPDIFKIYHCSFCNTAFSLPRVETNALYENIYKKGDLVPGYGRYWRYAKIVNNIKNPLDYLAKTEDTYWVVKEALSFYAKDRESTKILEIGSGLGYLTYSLINARYNVTGLDISPTAVSQAIKTYGEHYVCSDISGYARLHPESFDIIILTEVIEHINEPLDFIKSLLKLLKPGGRVIITTPNKSFYPKDIIWIPDLPPVHSWWYSEESMKYIAGRMNLEISFINFSNYYKENYHAVDMITLRGNQLSTPVFDKNGELKIQVDKSKKGKISYVRGLVKTIPFAKRISRKLKELCNPHLTVCRDRGTVLCAIMHRPES